MSLRFGEGERLDEHPSRGGRFCRISLLHMDSGLSEAQLGDRRLASLVRDCRHPGPSRIRPNPCWALGRTASDLWFPLDNPDGLQALILQLGLGLGILGLAVLLIRLPSISAVPASPALLLAATLPSWGTFGSVPQNMARLPCRTLESAEEAGPLAVLSFLAAAAIAGLAGLQALTTS
jgi:hypothetical protein